MTTPPVRVGRSGSVRRQGVRRRVSAWCSSETREFWRKDASGGRAAVPRRDRVQIVPDQNGEVLRLQSGDADLMTDLRARRRLRQLAAARAEPERSTLQRPASRSARTCLWFNLTPGAAACQGRGRGCSATSCASRFRTRSIAARSSTPCISAPPSRSSDRITPGHGDWYAADLPRTDFDRPRAKTLLAVDRPRGSQWRRHRLDDARGRPARFAILTQKGNTIRERTVAVIQESAAARSACRWTSSRYDCSGLIRA